MTQPLDSILSPSASKIFAPDLLSTQDMTLVQLTKDGPVAKHLGWQTSPLETSAIPEEQLSLQDRLLIEALPPPLQDSSFICAPVTPQQIKDMGPGPVAFCNIEKVSNMTESQKAQYREGMAVQLKPGDKVAQTPEGYLIMHPLPEFMD